MYSKVLCKYVKKNCRSIVGTYNISKSTLLDMREHVIVSILPPPSQRKSIQSASWTIRNRTYNFGRSKYSVSSIESAHSRKISTATYCAATISLNVQRPNGRSTRCECNGQSMLLNKRYNIWKCCTFAVAVHAARFISRLLISILQRHRRSTFISIHRMHNECESTHHYTLRTQMPFDHMIGVNGTHTYKHVVRTTERFKRRCKISNGQCMQLQ